MGLLRRMPDLRRVIQPTPNQNDKYPESPLQHTESPVHGNRLCTVAAAYIYVHSRELNSVQQNTPLPLFQDQTSEYSVTMSHNILILGAAGYIGGKLKTNPWYAGSTKLIPNRHCIDGSAAET